MLQFVVFFSWTPIFSTKIREQNNEEGTKTMKPNVNLPKWPPKWTHQGNGAPSGGTHYQEWQPDGPEN